MTTPQKLTPEQIEAASAIIQVAIAKGFEMKLTPAGDVTLNFGMDGVLAAASKHTGADDLAEALEEILNYDGGADSPFDDDSVIDRCHAALARYRALRGMEW